MSRLRDREFPLGAAVSVEELESDPHPVLERLREHEPVSWVPVLDGWIVTRHDLCTQLMRDAATYTVQDERFSTARVIGASMLSLDGVEHARHRAPFAEPFRPIAVRERFETTVEEEVERLLDALAHAGAGGAELRRGFAGPLAASIVARALGLGRAAVDDVLAWYDAIVAAVTQLSAAPARGNPPAAPARGNSVLAAGREAFETLSSRLRLAIRSGGNSVLAAAAGAGTLTESELVSNAAVLLFGGIETTEGMIANAIFHLLSAPDVLAQVREDPRLIDGVLEESLRLEPAAAVVDRYATADAVLAGASIARGNLVRLSISAANRDPAVFSDPNRLDLSRRNVRQHLAFAHGPHVCLGVHLARLEARTALAVLLRRLPDIALDPRRPAAIRGLVFRKPATLHVIWT